MISVTTVLKDAYERHAFRIPPERLQEAGERGSLVHRVIPSLIDPERFYVPLADKNDPVAQGYIKSFLDWYDLMVERTICLEEEVVCDCFQFVGHIDWVGVLIDGSVAVIDWKTPITEGKVWGAQLGAYFHLAQNHLVLPGDVKRIGAVQLDPGGKPGRLVEYTQKIPYRFNDFLIALNYRRTFG